MIKNKKRNVCTAGQRCDWCFWPTFSPRKTNCSFRPRVREKHIFRRLNKKKQVGKRRKEEEEEEGGV
jgi:hypothetical protein